MEKKGMQSKAKKAKKPVVDELTLPEIIKEAADAGITGIDDALKGLYEIFGGAKRKSSPVGLDRKTHEKVPPQGREREAPMYTKQQLKEKARAQWKKHNPEMFRELQESGEL